MLELKAQVKFVDQNKSEFFTVLKSRVDHYFTENNISKYANAQKISIESFIENDEFKIYIIDDGIGFDFLRVKKGIGFANIKRRAELFSGRMDIVSSIGMGCKLIITLPLHP